MASTRSTVAVKDTGTALVGTVQSLVDGITTEFQAIAIVDGTTPDNIARVNDQGRIEFDSPYIDTLLSYSITIVTGTSPTQIFSPGSSRVKLTVQNYTELGTNPTFYIGGSTVSDSTGYALLDGDFRIFDRMKVGLYAILNSGIITNKIIRILEERYE